MAIERENEGEKMDINMNIVTDFVIYKTTRLNGSCAIYKCDLTKRSIWNTAIKDDIWDFPIMGIYNVPSVCGASMALAMIALESDAHPCVPVMTTLKGFWSLHLQHCQL